MSIRIKLLSALEKCFTDEILYTKATIDSGSCLRGEDYHFTIAYTADNVPGWLLAESATLVCKSDLNVSFERVEQLPVRFPCHPARFDDNYLRRTPGLYPDLLIPMDIGETVLVPRNYISSIYGTVHVPEDTAAGDYTITIGLCADSGAEAGKETSVTLTLHVVDAVLPKQDLSVAQWVHYDCIADAHNLEIFSEEHWTAIENYLKVAVDHGINTILTPVFTPPLDTAVGGERPTVQLVDVTVTDDGYTFGFDKLRRFVALGEKIGVERYEISHLFTQWGAYHAPKVMATVNDEYRRLFGWETDAASDEYVAFLRAFITALIAEMKALGVAERMIFHISDEPKLEHLEQYKTVKSKIADLLVDYPIYDALSNFEFYETGVLDHPIPASTDIEPFLNANIDGLWTYYCNGQWKDVSNRYLAMPLARTRIIGTQFWKFHIAGFLHWGYNFYYTRFSKRHVNPYVITDADAFAPAGDAYSVYPAPDCKPYRSLRLVAFHEAICDLSALKLAEKLCGREAVLAVLEAQGEITFSSYPKDTNFLLDLREKINRMIEEKI